MAHSPRLVAAVRDFAQVRYSEIGTLDLMFKRIKLVLSNGLVLSAGCTRRSPHFGLNDREAVHSYFGKHHGEPTVVLLLDGVALWNGGFVCDKFDVGNGTLSQLVCGIANCVFRRFSSFSRTSLGSSGAFASSVNSLDLFKGNSTIDAAHVLSFHSVSGDSINRK